MENEKLHIENLIEKSTTYRETEILETAESDGVTVFLVDGRKDKPEQDSSSDSELKREICPYCQESIPCAHLGEIADWHITGNKYPGTDIEVIAMSKEHSSHLRNTDFRAWMHIAMATDSVLLYSPARKSVPSHKQVPLLDFKTSPLFTAKVKWVDEDVGYTSEHKHRAIVIKGDFEARLGKTIQILRQLYAKEQMHDITITPDTTYILPSKIIGRMLGNRVFIGIASTEDKDFFEYVKKHPDQRDGSFTIPDYSACDYEEDELLDLLRDTPAQVPIAHQVAEQLNMLHANVGAVLSLGENNVVSGCTVANSLNVEFQSCNFAFITDKKGNFFADCIPPSFKKLKNHDLLIVVSELTKNIEQYLLKLKDNYKATKVFVMSNSGGKEYNLEEIGAGNYEEIVTNPRINIGASTIAGGDINDFLREEIESIKKVCEGDPVFIEMVIGLNIENASDINDLQKEFSSATIKIMSLSGKKDWKTIDDFVHDDVQPLLRSFNPITSRLLAYITENYQDIIASEPKHKHEEGAIVLYVGDVNRIANTETFKNLIDILTMGTGRRVYIISDKKLENLTLDEDLGDSLVNPLSLKPGSEVEIQGDKVLKKMIKNELEAYMTLHRYSERLHNERVVIIIPELLKYDHNSQQGIISKVSDFPVYSPQEYFGLSKVYNIYYYKVLYDVSQILRGSIPSREVFDQRDYEFGPDDTIPTLDFIESSLQGDETTQIKDLVENVKKMIFETQDLIKDLQLYPSHRDPNPNNYMMSTDNEKVIVNLVDWETFGLARRGYEEGRFMSYLALDVTKQNDYIDFIKSNLSPAELVYFWRTVTTRTLREMLSMSHGHYDGRIIPTVKNITEVKQQKSRFIEAFYRLANRALNEINMIIKK